VLIHACDARDPAKQERPVELIGQRAQGVLLWQVCCEFLAASRKLGPQGFTLKAAWERLDEFAALLPIVPPSPPGLGVARQLSVERSVSLWDALLIGACVEAGVRTLYSEDLPGVEVQGLRIVNPFA
jgi:predicted nucleic acid-binding protein